jgi:hypothetical protein
MNSNRVFVAYPNAPHSGEIYNGVRKANAKLKGGLVFEPWEFNDISGRVLTEPIFDKIEASQFVVADATVLNQNVAFEMGFAIGRMKKCYIVRRKVQADEANKKHEVDETGIFDTLGYQSFQGDDDLCDKLTAYIDPKPV